MRLESFRVKLTAEDRKEWRKMLSTHNVLLLNMLCQAKMREDLRQALLDQLVSSITPPRTSRVPQPMCNALHQLGHLLMNLGERLEHLETSQVA
jgi:hypothetical protein